MEEIWGLVIPIPSFLEIGQLSPFTRYLLNSLIWVSFYAKWFANSFKLNLYYFYFYRWRNRSFGQDHLSSRWGIRTYYNWLQINTVLVATYIIMGKALLFCYIVWISSLREWGSTSLKDTHMTGSIKGNKQQRSRKSKISQNKCQRI